MADYEARVGIDFDVTQATAALQRLQQQISAFQSALAQGSAASAKAASNLQRDLVNNINATGKFSASMTTVASSAENFTRALETNKLSLGQYFRYAGASTRTFGRFFKGEFDTINKVVRERVKTIQTQFVKMGRDSNGALQAIKIRPLALDLQDYGTQAQMAAQRQAVFNQLVKQGSTQLLNFGKNTQWAGRQLMVGFTIPLTIMGATAVKEFEKIEKQAIRFKRVYGDAFSTTAETDQALKNVRALANEFTKYGIEVEKTLELAADAAQMGLKNADLLAQVTEATRLAVLGEVEQQEALETSISLTNAFGIAAEDLANKINFLNAVENETVTAISDLTTAIPKAGPVIQQLGGSVEDLAFFLTAMKEGGINASEGANALKSGLAKIINPTEKASLMLQGLGINLNAIVESNAGDIKNTVLQLADALDSLDPLNRARAIEELFGRFQFARISTLFQNIVREGSQAERVLKLSRASAEELAILSERELKRVEESPLFRFQKTVEKLQAALAPLGEEFLKAITPIVEFATQFLDNFNNMSEGAKRFAVVATTVIAGIGPIALMTFGLIANGVANLIKLFANIGRVFGKFGNDTNNLGLQTNYLTQEQLESQAAAISMGQAHANLTQVITSQTAAVSALAAAYNTMTAAQRRAAANQGIALPNTAAGPRPKKYNSGVLSVPGPKGAGDVVPAMLSPGEAVIPAKQSAKYAGLIQGMISDNIPGYRFGLNPFAAMLRNSRVTTRMRSDTLRGMLGKRDTRYRSAFETGTGDDYINSITGKPKINQQFMRTKMEETVMGIPRNAPVSARPTYGSVELTPMGRLLSRVFGLPGKQFRNIARPGNQYLDRYGDTELVGRRSLNRRSSLFAGDLLRSFDNAGSSWQYRRRQLGTASGSMLLPMRGASRRQLEAEFGNFRYPFGKNIPQGRSPSGGQYFTSNPGYPYVEAQVGGGFSLKDISKIRVPSRADARQLQKLVDQAGLRIRVTPQNASPVIKLLSNIFGTRFQDGVAKLSLMQFPTEQTLQASHFSSPISGEGTLSRQELLKAFDLELRKGVKQGLITESESKKLAQQMLEKLSKAKPGQRFKLYGNVVEPWVTAGNQGTAARNTTRSGASYLKDLSRMPKGLVGSGILARLPENHGIPNNTLKKYISDVQKQLKSQLKTVYGTRISEAELQKLFENAERNATKKIKSRQAASIIQKANAKARLGLTPGFVNTDGSGLSRRYLSGLYGDMQDRVLNLRKSGAYTSLFGQKFTDVLDSKFFKKVSVYLPKDQKLAAQKIFKNPAISKANRSLFINELIKNSDIPSQSARFRATQNTIALAESGKLFEGVVKPTTGAKKPAGMKVLGGSPADQRLQAVAPGETILSQKSTQALSRGNTVAVPGFGGRLAGLFRGRGFSVLGRADGIPDGQKIGGPANPFAKMANQTPPAVAVSNPQDIAKEGVKADERAMRSGRFTGAVSKVAGAVTAGAVGVAGRGLSWLNAGTATIVSKGGRQFDNGAELRTNSRGVQYGYIPGKGTVSVAEAKAAGAGTQQPQTGRQGSKPPGGGMMGGIAGVAGMAAMGYSMTGGPGADIAGMAAMPLMMAPMILSMLSTGVGAVVVGLAAAAGAFFLVKKALDEAGKKARETAESLGVGSSAMEKYAEFAGNVSATNVRDRQRASLFSPFSIQAGKNEFGANFLQSETGTQLLSSIRGAGGFAASESMLLSQLQAAVSGGSLTVTQARSVAYAIAEELGDQSIGMDINARLTQLFGPNGENLLNEPLKVQIAQISATQSNLGDAFNDFMDATVFTAEETTALVEEIADSAKDSINKALETGPLLAWAEKWLPLTTSLVKGSYGLGSDVIAQTVAAPMKQAEMSVAATSAYIVKASNAIQNYQSAIDSLDVSYDKQIAAAEAAGDEALAQDLINRKAKERNQLMEKYAIATRALTAQFEQSNEEQQKTLMIAATDRIKEKFKEDADSLKIFEAAAEKLKDGADEYELTMLLNADAITLNTFDWIANNLSATSIDRILNLETKLTGKDLGTMTSLLSRFGSDRTRQEFIAKFELAYDAEEAQDILGLFTEINNLADTLGGEKGQQLLDFYVDPANAANAESLKNTILELKEFDGEKLTIDYIQSIDGGEEFAQIIKGNQKYFDSLDKNQQIVYTQVIATIALGDPEQFMEDAIADAAASGQFLPSGVPEYITEGIVDSMMRGYANKLAEQRTRVLAALGLLDEGEVDTGTGNITNPLDEIFDRLQRVRNAAVGAKRTLAELIALMKPGTNTSTLFRGTDQKLLFAGYGSDFINAVMSMDEETRKAFVTINNGVVKVTEGGKALNKAFSEITLGDFQFSLVQGLADANKQTQALNILTGRNSKFKLESALSEADAMDIVSNATLAYAIATATTSEEVQQLINDFNNLQAAQRNLNFQTKEGTAEEFGKIYDKAVGFLEAQKATINAQFEVNTNADQDIIRQAQDEINAINFELDDYQAEISDIEELEKDVNKKYDTRLEALDKIQSINEDIARQEAATLDIADALAQGDIAAAARAVRQKREEEASLAIEKQKEQIEKAREVELARLTSTNGRTREQIEAKILELQKQISVIEEERLEPAQERIRLADVERQKLLDSLDDQIDKWNLLSAKVNESKLKLTPEEMSALETQAKLIEDMLQNWDDIEDREATLTIIKKTFDDNAPVSTPDTSTSDTSTSDTSNNNNNNNGNGGNGGDGDDGGGNVGDDGGNGNNGGTPTPSPTPAPAPGNPGMSLGSGPVQGPPSPKPSRYAPEGTVWAFSQDSNAWYPKPVPKPTKKPALGTEWTWSFAAGKWYEKKLPSPSTIIGSLTGTSPSAGEANRFENLRPVGTGGAAGTGLMFMSSGGMIAKKYGMGGKVGYYPMGGLIPYMGSGGLFKSINTDTVPAMLTPGEFVMRRSAVANYGTDMMKAINSNTYDGESVYNYSVNVNVQSDANPDQIARAVMTQIKQIDSQRIRNGRY